jgi:hypothetical protein
MIQLPRRSVTRFFIPLIDVLTLLFCIFLILPMIKGGTPAGDAAGADSNAATRQPPNANTVPESVLDDRASRDRLRQEREELDILRKAKIETLQNRLFIRVLEIDPDNGHLVYHEDNQRWEIASDADMQRLTERQRRAAGSRVLYYLLLYPRRITGFPERRQVQQYERWLSDVAHSFDNPHGNR